MILLSLISGAAFSQKKNEAVYQFKVNDINGEIFDFAHLEGKKIMIVNTASKCGFTKQFAELQQIYEDYKDNGFVVIGFPSNDFMNQDPGTNEEIIEFCQKNYGVTFPMMEKIEVKGKNKHPLYKYLTDKKYNGLENSKVSWNFQKYLINEEGYLDKVVNTRTKPNDPKIIEWIEGN